MHMGRKHDYLGVDMGVLREWYTGSFNGEVSQEHYRRIPGSDQRKSGNTSIRQTVSGPR